MLVKPETLVYLKMTWWESSKPNIWVFVHVCAHSYILYTKRIVCAIKQPRLLPDNLHSLHNSAECMLDVIYSHHVLGGTNNLLVCTQFAFYPFHTFLPEQCVWIWSHMQTHSHSIMFGAKNTKHNSNTNTGNYPHFRGQIRDVLYIK